MTKLKRRHTERDFTPTHPALAVALEPRSPLGAPVAPPCGRRPTPVGSFPTPPHAQRVGSGPLFRAEDHFASLSRVLKFAKNRLQHAVYFDFLRP